MGHVSWVFFGSYGGFGRVGEVLDLVKTWNINQKSIEDTCQKAKLCTNPVFVAVFFLTKKSVPHSLCDVHLLPATTTTM